MWFFQLLRMKLNYLNPSLTRIASPISLHRFGAGPAFHFFFERKFFFTCSVLASICCLAFCENGREIQFKCNVSSARCFVHGEHHLKLGPISWIFWFGCRSSSFTIWDVYRDSLINNKLKLPYRALSAGIKAPLLITVPHPRYPQAELVSALGALLPLYTPLNVREEEPTNKFEQLGLLPVSFHLCFRCSLKNLLCLVS